MTSVNTAVAEGRRSGSLFDVNYRAAFIMVTALFFMWALPSNLNDILIRQFMKSFEINRFRAGLVQSAFYLGYFVFSLPAALILRSWGYRAGLVTGLVLYGVGAMLFWPAALVDRFGCFLVALFVIAAGLAFLETGAGSFITQLGDPDGAARRLNLSQAFNPPGTIAGALIGTVFIFSGIEPDAATVAAMKAGGTYGVFLHQETMRVVVPYLVVSGVVFVVAFLLSRVRFPPLSTVTDTADSGLGSLRELLRHRHFVRAVIAQFFYMGAQVGIWSYMIQYAHEYAARSEKEAGYLLSFSLLVFAVGRFVATLLMKYVAPNVLMAVYAAAGTALVAVAILYPSLPGLACLIAVSFFLSLMFPTIFALGVKGLGTNTTLGASVIVMSIVGGAILTPLVGWLAELTHSTAIGLTVPGGCFLVVLHFSLWGYREGHAAEALGDTVS